MTDAPLDVPNFRKNTRKTNPNEQKPSNKRTAPFDSRQPVCQSKTNVPVRHIFELFSSCVALHGLKLQTVVNKNTVCVCVKRIVWADITTRKTQLLAPHLSLTFELGESSFSPNEKRKSIATISLGTATIHVHQFRDLSSTLRRDVIKRRTADAIFAEISAAIRRAVEMQ